MINKIYIVIILICLLIIGYYSCNKNLSKIDIPDIIVMKPEDTSSLHINTTTNNVTIQNRQDNGNIKVEQHFIPAESNYTIITSTNTGKTTINYKNKGFTLKPNINITYINQFSFGLGLRLYFWNEFGIVNHINYYIDDKTISYSLGIDYRLYKLKLKNVSFGINYDTRKQFRAQINFYLS